MNDGGQATANLCWSVGVIQTADTELQLLSALASIMGRPDVSSLSNASICRVVDWFCSRYRPVE